MPFGSQSCEDVKAAAKELADRLASPMPFGSQSCEDQSVTKHLMRFRLSPMPFGSQSCEDLECGVPWHECSAVTNAFRQSVL